MAESLRSLLEGKPSAASGDIISEVDFVPLMKGKFVTSVHKKSIIHEGHKLIRDDKAGRIELYDLLADPLEKHNLSESKAQLRDELIGRLDQQLDVAIDRAIGIQARMVGAGEVSSMRGLGYVGESGDEQDDHTASTTRPVNP